MMRVVAIGKQSGEILRTQAFMLDFDEGSKISLRAEIQVVLQVAEVAGAQSTLVPDDVAFDDRTVRDERLAIAVFEVLCRREPVAHVGTLEETSERFKSF